MKFYLLTLLVLTTNVLFADVYLSGTVSDIKQRAIAGVQVIFYSEANQLGSVLTDDEGKFKVNLEKFVKQFLRIEVKKPGWEFLNSTIDLDSIYVSSNTKIEAIILESDKKIYDKLTYGVQMLALKRELAAKERQYYQKLFVLELDLDSYNENDLYKYRFGNFDNSQQAEVLLSDIHETIIVKDINDFLNSANKPTPFVCQMKKGKRFDFLFKVQVLASARRLSTKEKKALEVKYNTGISEEHDSKTLSRYKYKYVTESRNSFFAARQLLSEVKLKGGKGGFIVCYKKGIGNKLQRFSKIRKWLLLK